MLRLESSQGVMSKIKTQIDYLIENGFEVSLLVGYGDEETLKNKKRFTDFFSEYKVVFFEIDYKYSLLFINKLYYLREFYQKLDIYLKSMTYDFIYFRGITAEKNLLKFSKIYNDRIIFEINSIMIDEYKTRKAYGKIVLNLLFMKKILNNSLACITITDEIARSIQKTAGRKIKTKTISNSVNVDSFPLVNKSRSINKEINLLFIGYIAEWHGLDRIIKGISRYKGEYKIKLSIVGDGTLTYSYKKMVKDNNLDSSVSFLGLVYGEDLDPLFDKCDIAISTLALHRQGLVETAALKNREYLSRGVPFVLSDIDVDLKDKDEISQFIFNVTPDDSPINIYEVVDFHKQLLRIETQNGGQYIKEKIRAFAKNNVDVSIKMKMFTEFILSLKSNSI